MKTTRTDPSHAGLAHVLHRVVQPTALSEIKHCRRHTQSLVLIGFKDSYFYLHSIKVLDAEMKHFKSSQQQEAEHKRCLKKCLD